MTFKFKKVAIFLATISVATSLYATENLDCGRFADQGLFMVDYSGSMNEPLAQPTEKSETKLQLALDVIEQIAAFVPKSADLDVGVISFAPHVVLVPPQKYALEDFQKAISKLPRKLEIFGRHTTLGEGLQGFATRIQTLKESSDAEEQRLADTFNRPAVLMVVTDGGQVNRGISAREGWQTFKEKHSSAKAVILSVAQTEDEMKNAEALGTEMDSPVFDAFAIAQSSDAAKQFVSQVLYRPCPQLNMTFSADTLFGFDKDKLTEKGKAEIQRFARLLLQNEAYITRTGITFSISAHTDKIGSVSYNQKLSQRRLNAVLKELQNNGVDLQLFVEKRAMGESIPITGNACKGLYNAEAIRCLQPDRRVEIRELVRK